ncbi:unnamed protein product [Brassica rapa subsp. trilocularis]|uniref:Uncharacterized protein n=2 Tax=Brassica TaxID=3705 RepID=A0A3P6D7Z1_BRACM|nr:unnamed protein product [Brassica napus]VDD16662.1 unnamed protein product [Brassica rapa]
MRKSTKPKEAKGTAVLALVILKFILNFTYVHCFCWELEWRHRRLHGKRRRRG